MPVLVSRYLVEVFDKSIAPAHNLPAIGETLVARAEGVTFNLRLGESLLGRAKAGAPRTERARAAGVSRRAVDLGITLPLAVVRRWNREYAGRRGRGRSLLERDRAGGDPVRERGACSSPGRSSASCPTTPAPAT